MSEVDLERMRELVLDLERSRRFEEESRQASESLVRCLRALAVGHEPGAMLEALLGELRAVLSADCAFVLAPAPGDPQRLVVAAASGTVPPGADWRADGLFARLSWDRPIATLFDVAQTEDWRGHLAPGGVASALHIFLGASGRRSFLVCGSGERGHFAARYIALARNLAPVAAQAIARAEDHLRLRAEIAERERMSAELRSVQERMLHLRKMEAVGQLAGGVAHELNTPLQYLADSLRFISTSFNSINNLVPTLAAWLAPHMDRAIIDQFLEASDYDYLAKELPKAIEQSQEGLERVAGIVRTLKAFAQTGTGEALPCDFNAVVRTTLDICQADIERVATVDFAPGALPQVACRVGEMRQVVYNLLVNAARAVEDRGGGPGRIALATSAQPGLVELVVADDGCGMDAEVLSRACEPFFTTRAVGQGMGQGLAVAHQAVHAHGGTLTLASQPGRGTTVTVRLPVRNPGAHPAGTATGGQTAGPEALASDAATAGCNPVAPGPAADSEACTQDAAGQGPADGDREPPVGTPGARG